MMEGDPMSDQDDQALRLLGPLREEPSGQPAYDVRKAMAEGRRRRRVKRWSALASASAVTLVTAGGGTAIVTAMRDPEPPVVETPPPPAAIAPAAPPKKLTCTMTKLPTGGIEKALVTAGDPTGRWLAGRIYPPGEEVRTTVWRDGRMVGGVEMPGADASIEDLNSAGVGVGTSYGASDRTQAYTYRNGTFRRLLGEQPSASAINDAGVIVGGAGPDDKRYPVRWASATATPARLPLPPGKTAGSASLIDEDGTIVGVVEKDHDAGTGHLWLPDGTARTMSLPTVNGRKATAFWPESIRNGRIAGRAVFDEENARHFTSMTYDVRTDTYSPVDAAFGADVLIADDGTVLGVTATGPTIIPASGKGITTLPSTKGKEYDLRSFSSDGRQAAGYSHFATGEKVGNEPIVWRCR